MLVSSITMWYRRHECGLRMAIFFSAATAAGAFGGLLARGILEMRGVAGLEGWRWLFILEGMLTFLIGSSPYQITLKVSLKIACGGLISIFSYCCLLVLVRLPRHSSFSLGFRAQGGD